MYYLQSRYFNPTIGRFLNADSFVSTGQGFVGNNMFAYCGNNSINSADPSGFRAYSALDDWRSQGSYSLFHADTANSQNNGLIFNQNDLPYSGDSFGLGTIANNGCTLVAIYNCLQLCGIHMSLEDIYLAMCEEPDVYGIVAFGKGGVMPSEIPFFLAKQGILCTGSFSADKLTANVRNGSIFTFTIWNNANNYIEGWHCITVLHTNEKYIAFNLTYNQRGAVVADSMSELLGIGGWIYGVRIDP